MWTQAHRSFVLFAGACLFFSCVQSAMAQTQQEHVHGMAHAVMPFDVSKTTHIFTMTETGGVERAFVTLPLGELDRLSLQHRLSELGKLSAQARTS